MRSSYNLGDLIPCFRFHVPQILVDRIPFNGVVLVLDVTTVVGSGGFGESFWVGKDFKVLI